MNLTFFPMYWLGVAGMPLRIPEYPDAYHIFNKISSWGAEISVISLLCFVTVIIEAIITPKIHLTKIKIKLALLEFIHALRSGGNLPLRPWIYIIGLSGIFTKIFITKNVFLVPIFMAIIAFSTVYLLAYSLDFVMKHKKYKNKFISYFEVNNEKKQISLLQKRKKRKKNYNSSRRAFSTGKDETRRTMGQAITDAATEITLAAGVTEGIAQVADTVHRYSTPSGRPPLRPADGPTGFASEMHVGRYGRSNSQRFLEQVTQESLEALKNQISTHGTRGFFTRGNVITVGAFGISSIVTRNMYEMTNNFLTEQLGEEKNKILRRHSDPTGYRKRENGN